MASLEWRKSKREGREYPRLIAMIDGRRYRPRIPNVYTKLEAERWLRRFNQMGTLEKIEVLKTIGALESEPEVKPDPVLFENVAMKYL